MAKRKGLQMLYKILRRKPKMWRYTSTTLCQTAGQYQLGKQRG
jgi:hypothetical protein